jgi:hypothetical protein
MALVSGVGVTVDGIVPAGATGRRDERWFGEVASSVVVVCPPDNVGEIERLSAEASVPCARVGHTGGDAVVLGDDGAPALAILAKAAERALVPRR